MMKYYATNRIFPAIVTEDPYLLCQHIENNSVMRVFKEFTDAKAYVDEANGADPIYEIEVDDPTILEKSSVSFKTGRVLEDAYNIYPILGIKFYLIKAYVNAQEIDLAPAAEIYHKKYEEIKKRASQRAQEAQEIKKLEEKVEHYREKYGIKQQEATETTENAQVKPLDVRMKEESAKKAEKEAYARLIEAAQRLREEQLRHEEEVAGNREAQSVQDLKLNNTKASAKKIKKLKGKIAKVSLQSEKLKQNLQKLKHKVQEAKLNLDGATENVQTSLRSLSQAALQEQAANQRLVEAMRAEQQIESEKAIILAKQQLTVKKFTEVNETFQGISQKLEAVKLQEQVAKKKIEEVKAKQTRKVEDAKGRVAAALFLMEKLIQTKQEKNGKLQEQAQSLDKVKQQEKIKEEALSQVKRHEQEAHQRLNDAQRAMGETQTENSIILAQKQSADIKLAIATEKVELANQRLILATQKEQAARLKIEKLKADEVTREEAARQEAARQEAQAAKIKAQKTNWVQTIKNICNHPMTLKLLAGLGIFALTGLLTFYGGGFTFGVSALVGLAGGLSMLGGYSVVAALKKCYFRKEALPESCDMDDNTLDQRLAEVVTKFNTITGQAFVNKLNDLENSLPQTIIISDGTVVPVKTRKHFKLFKLKTLDLVATLQGDVRNKTKLDEVAYAKVRFELD